MQIHTLETTKLEILTEAFNNAFEGYFVPLNLSVQNLADKIKSENILLEHSVGITVNEQLAGFILIGIDNELGIAYNAGTGIKPEFRGQKLTEKMYSFVISGMNKIGIKNHLLEVICQNTRALKVYENQNYVISRNLICYKGKISKTGKSDYKIETISLPQEAELNKLWNHNPAYQNSFFCIKNNRDKHTTFGVFSEGRLIAYIIFDTNTLRIKQFGVDKGFRKKGIGHQLFYEVQKQNPEATITIINVDGNDSASNEFLQNIGLEKFIELYEMRLNIN